MWLHLLKGVQEYNMYVYEDTCTRVDVYASHHVAQLTAMIIAMHITISEVSPNFLAIN